MFRIALAFATLIILSTAGQSQATCLNEFIPGGYVFPTSDPRTFQILVYDQDNWNSHVIALYASDITSTPRYYFKNVTLKLRGVYYIFAVNVDTCGRIRGTNKLISILIVK